MGHRRFRTARQAGSFKCTPHVVVTEIYLILVNVIWFGEFDFYRHWSKVAKDRNNSVSPSVGWDADFVRIQSDFARSTVDVKQNLYVRSQSSTELVQPF